MYICENEYIYRCMCVCVCVCVNRHTYIKHLTNLPFKKRFLAINLSSHIYVLTKQIYFVKRPKNSWLKFLRQTVCKLKMLPSEFNLPSL